MESARWKDSRRPVRRWILVVAVTSDLVYLCQFDDARTVAATGQLTDGSDHPSVVVISLTAHATSRWEVVIRHRINRPSSLLPLWYGMEYIDRAETSHNDHQMHSPRHSGRHADIFGCAKAAGQNKVTSVSTLHFQKYQDLIAKIAR